MSMTKKDYELIARTITGWYNVYSIEYYQLEGIASHFADRLEINNDKFDRNKFLTACGVK